MSLCTAGNWMTSWSKMKLILLALLSLLCIHMSTCVTLDNSEAEEFQKYHKRVNLLQSLLSSQCPTAARLQRPPISPLATRLSLEKDFYNQLENQLILCKISQSLSPTSLPPSECSAAINLTESWRLDHSGSRIKPDGPNSFNGYACDFRKDLQWFRFSGAAGSRLLSSPPKPYSCGTYRPYWTDAEMPSSVGDIKMVEVFTPVEEISRAYIARVEVMRCSKSPNDFIYRYVGTPATSCYEAFCGMM